MSRYNPLAEALNKDLQAGAPQIFSMLSERGKAIYFPFKGILGQTAEAKGAKINATIGTAFENDGSPLTLECMEALVNIPSDSFLYAPSFGLPKLREEWGKLLSVKNPGLKGKTFSQPVLRQRLRMRSRSRATCSSIRVMRLSCPTSIGTITNSYSPKRMEQSWPFTTPLLTAALTLLLFQRRSTPAGSAKDLYC